MRKILSAFSICTLALMATSCSSSPSQQAASIIDRLDENARILAFNSKGQDPNLIVVQRDSVGYSVVKHDIDTKTCDTIAVNLTYEPIAVRQGEHNYLVVSAAPDPLNDNRTCALVAYYEKGKPGTELSRIEINNTDKDIITLPTSFMINDAARQMYNRPR